jgi:S-adenosyl methyltransferase
MRRSAPGRPGGRYLTLVEPGLTDIWAWRPDAAVAPTDSEFMRILGGVARKG